MSGTSQQILNRVVFALGVALIVATGVVFTGHQTRSDAAGGAGDRRTRDGDRQRCHQRLSV